MVGAAAAVRPGLCARGCAPGPCARAVRPGLCARAVRPNGGQPRGGRYVKGSAGGLPARMSSARRRIA